MNNCALVLEGGGMRGIFTCGVLDYFLDKNIEFPYVIGTSAGAGNAASFISKQRGRARYSNIDLMDEYNYISYRNLFRKGSMVDFDLLYYKFSDEIYPFDYQTYFNSTSSFEIVTSNCFTGTANYFEEKHERKRLISLLKASASLPFICPISHVDQIPMLDGGICDSIPLQRALSQGASKIVVVLTRNKGYRKKPQHGSFLSSIFYRKYPEICVAIKNRNTIYNQQLELVERLEQAGTVLVIRPKNIIEVDRLEKNVNKLQALYEDGYYCANSINNFLDN